MFTQTVRQQCDTVANTALVYSLVSWIQTMVMMKVTLQSVMLKTLSFNISAAHWRANQPSSKKIIFRHVVMNVHSFGFLLVSSVSAV